ncbi:MAG TPA: hypothetical protein VEA99_15460 [Gemmatimonadaceae bacterium]|nr:hypothetical protein [Gemmatimonadaceae bacterium]
MKKWLRRARGAIGLGLLWAVGGVGIAAVLELLDNVMPAAHPLTRLVDMWPQTLAILGFLAGTIFGIVLGVAGARRRFDELSVPWFTAWGALAGLSLGALLGAPAPIIGVVTVASALGGAASLALARRAQGARLAPAADEPSLGRPDRTARELPDGRR